MKIKAAENGPYLLEVTEAKIIKKRERRNSFSKGDSSLQMWPVVKQTILGWFS